MRTLRFGLAAGIGLLTAVPVGAAESGTSVSYRESLEALSISTVAPALAANGPEATMRFQAMGREFDFRLQPNRALLAAVGQRIDTRDIAVYRGRIAGVAGSWARFVVTDGAPRGMFFDGTTVYAVEAGVDAAGQRQPTIFRLEDLAIEPGALACDHVAHAKDADQLLAAVKGETGPTIASAPGATSNMDVGLVADFEFTNSMGSATDAELLARMNVVDGIFSSQLGVQLTVTHIDSFASASDPFSDSSDSNVLLDELDDFRFQSLEQRSTGLTHMFTGRDLDGSNVGIAYSGSLCSSRFGAGLTQGTHGSTIDALIAAHEIGHNFGAPHDSTSGSPCESEPAIYLMAPSVNGSDQFSSCSITEMQDDIAAASCIGPMPSTDIAVVAGSVPATVYTDDAVSVTFDVDSVGTEDAADVTLDVTIPATVTVNGVSATSGSCSTGAGTASCTLGTIAGGSGVTVTLDTTAASAGNATFTAVGDATSDENANNNDATAAYTITSAVDLAVLPAASAQVALNAAVTIRPVLENRSSLAATNVTLTITPDAGLRIESVSAAGANCGIDAGGVASCQLATLPAQDSESVDVQVTGIAEGPRSYTITAASDEADRDMTNNNRAGQVTVGDPPAAPEESGGGSFGLVGLLVLIFARAILRRRVRPI